MGFPALGAPAGQARQGSGGQPSRGAWGVGQTAALLAKAVKERGATQQRAAFFCNIQLPRRVCSRQIHNCTRMLRSVLLPMRGVL